MEMLHCSVSGRVQGVGFRYSALAMARSLGLRGWVRNLPDGSVETMAWGSPEQITAYLDWLGAGSSMARVDGVNVIERRNSQDTEIPDKGFRIKF